MTVSTRSRSRTKAVASPADNASPTVLPGELPTEPTNAVSSEETPADGTPGVPAKRARGRPRKHTQKSLRIKTNRVKGSPLQTLPPLSPLSDCEHWLLQHLALLLNRVHPTVPSEDEFEQEKNEINREVEGDGLLALLVL